ncbi:MAG TPA: UDP-N-acetyl-D-glucosamine dehydrogenase [Myxococcales bacterium]|nr:UDP-N-acetyl-D-glucosamine dehydrogenase [Myxococcales bacterium]
MSLKQRIATKDAKIAVVGLGYVGLPLAVRIAEAGLVTHGIDVNEARVERINNGVSDIGDVDSADLAPQVTAGMLTAHTDFAVIAQVDAVIICVPTPLSKTRDPDISFIVKATESISPHIRRDQLFVLESTTYPGFTTEVLAPTLEQASGFKAGKDFHVAFSPERIDPGNERFGVRNTTKIVGAMTTEGGEAVEALYETFIDNVRVVSSPNTAEMVKLLENTFRAVNIGLVNELALMCHKLGLNTWEVIDAAATKPFGFMPFYPGPGLGGHCIPIDPLYLSWKLRSLNYQARFIELADSINTGMPRYVVRLVQDALNDEGKATRGARVVVLGVAYKNDIDDYRESPAIDVIELLEGKGAHVDFYDPYVPSYVDGGVERMGLTNLDELGSYDAAVITTHHKSFDYDDIVNRSRLVVDTRNATRDVTVSRNKIHLL